MEITEHIDALRCQGDLLADAATRAGLDASVPTCPSWQVKDLLRHTGYIHRWAARHITECPDAVLDGPPEADILRGGAADPDLLVWFRAGHAALVETLSTADPGLVCATFMAAPSPLAFWARRQAHETAIHRADAEPREQVRVGRAATQDVLLRRTVEHGVRALGDVPGRPAVDVPGMPEQVLDPPGRAGRDGRVQTGPGGRGREHVTLPAKRVDVLGDLHTAILPG